MVWVHNSTETFDMLAEIFCRQHGLKLMIGVVARYAKSLPRPEPLVTIADAPWRRVIILDHEGHWLANHWHEVTPTDFNHDRTLNAQSYKCTFVIWARKKLDDEPNFELDVIESNPNDHIELLSMDK